MNDVQSPPPENVPQISGVTDLLSVFEEPSSIAPDAQALYEEPATTPVASDPTQLNTPQTNGAPLKGALGTPAEAQPASAQPDTQALQQDLIGKTTQTASGPASAEPATDLSPQGSFSMDFSHSSGVIREIIEQAKEQAKTTENIKVLIASCRSLLNSTDDPEIQQGLKDIIDTALRLLPEDQQPAELDYEVSADISEAQFMATDATNTILATENADTSLAGEDAANTPSELQVDAEGSGGEAAPAEVEAGVEQPEAAPELQEEPQLEEAVDPVDIPVEKKDGFRDQTAEPDLDYDLENLDEILSISNDSYESLTTVVDSASAIQDTSQSRTTDSEMDMIVEVAEDMIVALDNQQMDIAVDVQTSLSSQQIAAGSAESVLISASTLPAELEDRENTPSSKGGN